MTTTQIVTNPFAAPTSGAVSHPVADQATAGTDQARAVAEVQAALMIARMNPRDPVQAMDRILKRLEDDEEEKTARFLLHQAAVSGLDLQNLAFYSALTSKN